MQAISKPLHPSPDRVRDAWMNLNGAWEFSLGEPKYDKTITVPFSWTAPLSGIGDESKGTGYYRRTVCYDAKGDRLFLIFGAVDYEATVRVNGIFVGSHIGGYTRFELDVTDAWNSAGENVIELDATDLDEPHQTYGKQGYGNVRGIWQTVWLERRPAVHLTSFTIRTKIDGSITIDYTASKGTPDATAFFDGKCHAGANGKISFKIENPRLWSPSDPYLYEGELRLGADTVKTYFGIREISAARISEDGLPYLLLNGSPIFLAGVLDQSYNPDGFFTYPTNEEEENEILRLKELGLNLVRIHIKPEEPRKLYHADRLGMLVMEDMPCFWGDPTPIAKAHFESQMRETIARDVNHPSIIYWVVFNETWGLFTKTDDGKVYLPETQEWVRACYREVKALDPSRLVEDNSPCNHDHVETDVLTWHFYRNGYKSVKAEVERFCREAAVGASGEYIGKNVNRDIPAMNSECGNYWGILDGGAGDSDLSWHYRYMMNEFRLHDCISGFVFTEFHDVINEFNGYLRIDSTKKDFGYGGCFPGMTVSDLHGELFLALDCPPMQSAEPGETFEIPTKLSCFSEKSLNLPFVTSWQAVQTDRLGRETTVDAGKTEFLCRRYGLGDSGVISVKMPETPGTVTLRAALTTPTGEVMMRNFVCFDVDIAKESLCRLPVTAIQNESFSAPALHQRSEKWNGLGAGSASFTVEKSAIPGYASGDLLLAFEASTKETLTKDLPETKQEAYKGDIAMLLGEEVDRTKNPNTFPMTDEQCYPGKLTVSIEGKEISAFDLPDCPADSRGILSHFYQETDNRLDEVGSYGYLCRTVIPAALLETLPDRFTVTLTADRGLSIFGRRSGRFPIGIDLSAI